MKVIYNNQIYEAKRFSELTQEEIEATTRYPYLWGGNEVFIKITKPESNEWSYLLNKEFNILSE